MPTRVKNIRSARTTRKNSIQNGKASKKPGCETITGYKAKDCEIIGGSLFALTLPTKRGYEVIQHLGRRARDNDDYEKMYNDLYAAVVKANRLLKLGLSDLDPYRSGLKLDQAFFIIINRFKEHILPNGFEISIDRSEDEEEYHISIHKQVEFPWCWHTFEIKGPVEYLSKKNKAVHDLFIDVMAHLYKKCQISTWWNDFIWQDNVMWDLDEYIMRNFEFETDEEELLKRAEIAAVVNSYKSGEAKHYETLLRQSSKNLPYLERKLKNFKSTNPVVKWMKEAVLFLSKPGCIGDYDYGREYYYDDGGVTIDRQACIIWDEDDLYTEMEGEGLDMEAQSGVQPATIFIQISKKTKAIDLANLEERSKWMKQLSDLQTSYREMIQKITK